MPDKMYRSTQKIHTDFFRISGVCDRWSEECSVLEIASVPGVRHRTVEWNQRSQSLIQAPPPENSLEAAVG